MDTLKTSASSLRSTPVPNRWRPATREPQVSTPDPGSTGSEQPACPTPAPLWSLTVAALALPGLAIAGAVGPVESVVVEAQEIGIHSVAQYEPTGASRMVGSMPRSPTATKRYSVECYKASYAGEPIKIRVKVKNVGKKSPFLLKATLEKDGQTQALIADRNSRFGPYLELSGGTGTYTLTLTKVKKSETAPDNTLKKVGIFQTVQECDDAKNAYTGIKKPRLIR